MQIPGRSWELALAALLSMAACAAPPPAPPAPLAEEPPPAAQPAVAAHTRYEVVAGDTLFEIARDHAVSLEEVVGANAIPDPDRLEVGHVLRIPVAAAAAVPPAHDFDAGESAKAPDPPPQRSASEATMPADPPPPPAADPPPPAGDPPPAQDAGRSAEVAALLEDAQSRHQGEDYDGALDALARADAIAADLPDDEPSKRLRAQVALMTAMVNLGQGDDAAALQRFAQVLDLLPHYVPPPGAFSMRALELLEQARSSASEPVEP